MSRSVRYHCNTDGPFLVEVDTGRDRPSPRYRTCPKCGWQRCMRVNRRKPGGKSISVPYAVRERLKAEATRRGTSMRALVEEYTKDVK